MSGLDSRRGAASPGLNTGLMIASFLCIFGLMYWLTVTAEPTQLEIAEEGIDEGEVGLGDLDMAPPLAVADFAANPRGYEGQLVRLSALEVSSVLSDYLVWVNVSSGAPYLVKLDSVQVAQGLDPQRGAVINMAGQVRTMTSGILDDWVGRGWLDADARIEAEFATSFMDAGDVEVIGENMSAGSES